MLLLKRNNLTSLLFIILLSLPAIFSLFHPGFFVSDDGEWMIIRFSAFHQALVDGQFPPRFLGRLNHEYGYPVANFLYPGFMYLAEIPKILGFGFVDSIKIILGLSVISSSVFTYLWLNKIFTKLPAFIAALFYLYAPYHLYDLYKRGSVGEVLALAVVPFILWQIERKNFILTGIGIASLILSHNTLALLFLPIILIYMISRKVLDVKYYALSIILGIFLSSFFWMPALFDLQHTVFSKTPVSDWGQYFVDIKLIGISTLFVLVITAAAMVMGKITIKKHKLTLLIFIFTSISLFLSVQASTFLWKILPVSFIQFPFRFLSITILGASFLVACLLSIFPKNITYVGVLVMLSLIFQSNFIKPSEFVAREEGFYTTNMASTTVQNEYMPKWVVVGPIQKPEKIAQFVIGQGTIQDMVANNKKISFTVLAEEDSFVRVNKLFFPGWKAKINDEDKKIYYNNPQGVMDVEISKGESRIVLEFGETRIRTIADFISVLGLLILGILVKRKI